MTKDIAPPTDANQADQELTIFNRLPTRWLLLIVLVTVLAAWLLNTPPGWLGKADAVGYALCHQISERSFQINGQPISLCARCTGMYMGALVGILYQLGLGRRRTSWPDKKYLVVLAIFFTAFAIDGSNSAAKLFLQHGLLYEPNNTLRLLTGTGMGLTMAAMILPTFHQTIWKSYSLQPFFTDWKQFAGMVAAGYTAAALILTDNPAILLVFTFFSVAGVIVLLVMLYMMILMVIFDRENRIERPSQLIPWLVGGLIVTFLHIGLIDLGRFLLTGTWEGFHLEIG